MPTIDLGFTGTQKGMTSHQGMALESLVRTLGPIDKFRHGTCVGSDEQAHYRVRYLVKIICAHPPINRSKAMIIPSSTFRIDGDPEGRSADIITYPPKEYLDRNRDIVDQVNCLIATPDGPERQRSGTWYTIRYARKKGKEVYIIMPNGILKEY